MDEMKAEGARGPRRLVRRGLLSVLLGVALYALPAAALPGAAGAQDDLHGVYQASPYCGQHMVQFQMPQMYTPGDFQAVTFQGIIANSDGDRIVAATPVLYAQASSYGIVRNNAGYQWGGWRNGGALTNWINVPLVNGGYHVLGYYTWQDGTTKLIPLGVNGTNSTSCLIK